LLKGRAIAEEQVQSWMERKNSYYLEGIRSITPAGLLPGARELLEEIRAAGMKTAIASASKNAGEVVNRLGIQSLIDVLADGFSVQRTKPAPDLFLYAARRLGEQPETCVVVEDAASGIEAAHAAGMHTVGLGPVERVGGAAVILENLAGIHLHELLARLETVMPRQDPGRARRLRP
jgi:HAD superfamily hydrolase (TIGR01509 family)